MYEVTKTTNVFKHQHRFLLEDIVELVSQQYKSINNKIIAHQWQIIKNIEVHTLKISCKVTKTSSSGAGETGVTVLDGTLPGRTDLINSSD